MTISTVSVIVATYRRDSVLQRALASLMEQTYKSFEIILVDDNDDSDWNNRIEKIVTDFKKSNPEVSLQYIQNHPSAGSAQARNAGIAASTGEYVCFLDDDDLYCPKRIENQILPMRERNADYSMTNLALYSTSDKLIEVRKRGYIKETVPAALMRYHLMYHMTGTDTMMFRREYLVQIGGFPPIDVGDEFYLMEKAIQGGGTFLYVPVCDVKAYVHTGEDGLSSGIGKIEGENRLFEYKKAYFEGLDKKAVRYIKTRHFVVLAYAYLRMRKIKDVIKYVTLGFITSPMQFLKILFVR